MMDPLDQNSLTAKFIKAEDEADLILEAVGVIKPPVPISVIKEIFPDLKFHIMPFNPEASGLTIAVEGVWHIFIDPNLTPQARRFTAFHEFFHTLQSDIGFSKSDPENKIKEKTANYFASCILMPAQWVREKWDLYHNIDKLAGIFQVSKSAMEIRIQGLRRYLNLK